MPMPKKKNCNCSLNPNCPFYGTIVELRNDVSWLKKLFTMRTIVDIITFISMISFLFSIWQMVK